MTGLMEESLLFWALNGTPQPPLLCTAAEEEALLTGYLITSGRVASHAQILQTERQGAVWQVTVAGEVLPAVPLPEQLTAIPPNESGFRLPLRELTQLCDEVMAADHGTGLHAVLLSDGERTVTGADIGRHNALDKAVGKAVAAGMDLHRTSLCTTARISLEFFVKAARAGIPVLATRKQIGSLSAARGEMLHITVCRIGGEPACLSAKERVY